MILGIDFGTCFSSVAYIDNGKAIPVAFNGTYNVPTLISCVDGKFYFGKECEHGMAKLKGAASNIKTYVRNGELDKVIMAGTETFTVRRLVKEYLNHLISEGVRIIAGSGTSRHINSHIEKIAIASPAGIGSGNVDTTDKYHKFLIELIHEITGLENDKIYVVNEPVAAALSFYQSEERSHQEEENILIFDLGGGTLDITIASCNIDNDKYDIIVKDGDRALGGNDWDKTVQEWFLRKNGVSNEEYVRTTSSLDRDTFMKDIVEVKEDLSKNLVTRKTIYLDRDGYADLRVDKFSRSEFENVTKNLLDRAMKCLGNSLKNYSGNIDKVILVGGGSNMPQIKEGIKNSFPQFKDRIYFHSCAANATSMGAAFFANKLEKINDITLSAFGFQAQESNSDRERIYNLIFKGMPYEKGDTIYAESPEEFHATSDKIKIVICESDVLYEERDRKRWIDLDSKGVRITKNVATYSVPKTISDPTQFKFKIALSVDKRNGTPKITLKQVK